MKAHPRLSDEFIFLKSSSVYGTKTESDTDPLFSSRTDVCVETEVVTGVGRSRKAFNKEGIKL